MDIYVFFLGKNGLHSICIRILHLPIAEAAKVLIGPALIAFTLIPLAPKSLARYLTLASRADLQHPLHYNLE